MRVGCMGKTGLIAGAFFGMSFFGMGLLLGFGQPDAYAMIVINEVLADPAALGGDANRDGFTSTTQDEFIELVNPSSSGISLGSWTLSDAIKIRHVFDPSASIAPWEFLVVFGGGSPNGFQNVTVASTGSLSLNNAGDTVTLRDDAGLIIDIFTYGSEGGADTSLTRFPDAFGTVVKHNTVAQVLYSPEATVDGLSKIPHSDASPVIPEPSCMGLIGFGILVITGRKFSQGYCPF